ncbi:MAG TPA: D-glycero-beta-D-manno-heptose 1-phosphate adenylyltransferase [Cytophagales bacterium]|nr:D-glycero-beta-D-manno-heptose 1-phosphate adenylyltransferase [Cytophagales bacterium]
MGIKLEAAQKIVNWSSAFEQVSAWKKQDISVVFTNGCFDILHLGHVDYLEKARALGDKLVVGLNTDASVKRQEKSPERPINDEYSRARLLASLFFVDLVVLFDEQTPYDIIAYLQPNVLVKGDDYAVENIVGANIVINNGGVVKTVPLVKGYSTTKIVNKIKNLN